MKKLLLLFAVFGMTFFALSCNEERDEKAPDDLRGTTWVASQKVFTETYTTTLSFAIDDYTVIVKDGNGEQEDGWGGTYLYDATSGTVMLSENGETTTGTIRGNRMTFIDGTTFVRQR